MNSRLYCLVFIMALVGERFIFSMDGQNVSFDDRELFAVDVETSDDVRTPCEPKSLLPFQSGLSDAVAQPKERCPLPLAPKKLTTQEISK